MLKTTRKWIRQLVDNRSAIRRDALLGVSYLGDLPRLVSPYKGEPEIKSELDWHSYNSVSEALAALYQVLVPGQRLSASLGTLVCYPPRMIQEETPSRWFFINGLGTPAPTALLNASELARVFRRPIHLLHTPTWSLWRDLATSITARTLRKDGQLSRPAAYVIQQALEQNERVVLVSHSQGTIVASYIVRKLLRHDSTRQLVKKLELYCIGGIADSLEVDTELSDEAGHPVPYVEHFANGRDYLAEIGVLSHLDNTEGAVFCIPKRSGHLLNLHYLAGIARGDYCQRRSRLYHYVRGREPGKDDFIAFDMAEEA
jgi:hypothetical protein